MNTESLNKRFNGIKQLDNRAFLAIATLHQEDEMKFKLKKEKWEYIRDNKMPWTDKDIVDIDEIDQQIEYCKYNARLTRKRLEILEILRKEHCM